MLAGRLRLLRQHRELQTEEPKKNPRVRIISLYSAGSLPIIWVLDACGQYYDRTHAPTLITGIEQG